MMWETRKLGDVLKVVRGSSPRPIKNYVTDSEDGVNWVKIGDVDERDKYVTRTKEKISRIGAEKSRFVDVGDFIFSNSMSFGRAYIMAIPGYIHDGWFTFKLPDYLNPDYLWYLFRSPLLVEQIKGLAAGAIVQNISSDLIKKCDLPIPPLEEQQKIVEKLDKAFELIDQSKANIEQNIVNAKELFQSKLDEVFSQKGDGWMDSRLQDICEKITDGTHQTPTYFESGYVFLSSKNVTTGKIDWDNVKYIDEVQHNAMYRRVAPKMGDILLAKNGTTGIAAIVDRDVIFDIYVSLAWIRSKGDVLPEYLLRYINSPLAKTQFNSRLKGIGVPNLHLKEIREVVIRYPINKIEQEKYADYIQSLDDEINRLVSMYNVKLSNLEELRKSILEKAFKGELTN